MEVIPTPGYHGGFPGCLVAPWTLHSQPPRPGACMPWERPQAPAEVGRAAGDPSGMQSFPWDSWAWGEDAGPQRQPTSPRQFPAWDLTNAGSRNPAGREKGVAGREEMEVPFLGLVIRSIFKRRPFLVGSLL